MVDTVIQANKSALIGLASRFPGSLGRSLFDYEEEIFSVAFQAIYRSPAFARDAGEIIQQALRHYNFDFVRKFLNGCDQDVLRGHPSIVSAAINGYGARNESEFGLNDDVRVGCERVNEKDDLKEMVILLIQYGAKPDGHDSEDHDRSPFYHATMRGFDGTFKLLLDAGADPLQTCTTPEGSTDLLQFAFQRLSAHTGMVDRAQGLNWFNSSLQHRWPSIIKQLLRRGCPVEVSSTTKLELFIEFCERGTFEDVQLLLHVLDPDLDGEIAIPKYHHYHGSRGSRTALHAAAYGGHLDVVRLLLEAGANPTITCSSDDRKQERLSPIQYMIHGLNRRDKPFLEICELLLDYGASLKDGEEVLNFYLEARQTDEVSRLLERGYSLLDTPIPVCDDVEFIDLLCSKGAQMDLARFMDLAIGRDTFGATRTTSIALLKYLQAKHGLRVDPKYFGEIACYVMADENRGMQMLDLIMQDLGHDVNSEFSFYEEVRPKTRRTNRGGYSSHVFSDDFPEPGAQTNLLQLACRCSLFKAAQRLLAQGANPDYGGIGSATLEHHLRANSYSQVLPLVVKMFSEHDPAAISRMVEFVFGRDDPYANSDLVETVIDLASKSDLGRIQQLSQHRVDAFQNWRAPVYQPAGSSDEHDLSTPMQETDLPEPPPLNPVDSSDLPSYRHDPLPGPSTIRLLQLMPAAAIDDPIVCTVEQCSLSDTPPFGCVSYVWGDARSKIGVEVNGAYLEITRNLANTLQRLRDPLTPCRLWVDAICINQADLGEKSQQIPLMRDIYLSAERTFVYIGEAPEGLGPAFKVQTFNRDRVDLLTCPGGLQFIELSRRPYFFRTWTIQEFTLGRKPEIICGPHSCQLNDFMSSILEATAASGGRLKTPPHFTRWSRKFLGAFDEGRISRLFPRDIISMSELSAATDPRDKIYGLQGLLEKQLIPVDYSWTVERVYIEFTKAALQDTQDFDVVSSRGWQKRSFTLPSWTPDYSVSRFQTLPSGFRGRSSGRGHNDRLKGLRFEEDRLIVKGKRIETIARLGFEWPGVSPSIDSAAVAGSNDVQRDWGSIVCQLVQMRGVSALYSFGEILNGRSGAAFRLSDEIFWWDHEFGAGILRRSIPIEFQRAELKRANCYPRPQYNKIWWDPDPPTIAEICGGRKLFVTAKGKLGLAPTGTIETDEIVFIPSAKHAMVIRQSGPGKHVLIGDCVLGDLDVEALFAHDSEILMEEFVFE